MKNTEEEVDIEEYEDKIRDLTSKLGKYQTQHIDMKENCMVIHVIKIMLTDF